MDAHSMWRLICALEGEVPKASDCDWAIRIWLMLNPFYNPMKEL
jgi:hypothetical protein